MKPLQLIPSVFGLVMSLFAGCAEGPKSPYGFTLPDGNAGAGQALFVSYQCHGCHTVSGVELPKLDFEVSQPVAIGGKVSRIQTYGELVTSIINPSHKLASGYREEDIAEDEESKMTNYNDVMTVNDLIDLVAFLQSHFELKPYEPTAYDVYHYGP